MRLLRFSVIGLVFGVGGCISSRDTSVSLEANASVDLPKSVLKVARLSEVGHHFWIDTWCSSDHEPVPTAEEFRQAAETGSMALRYCPSSVGNCKPRFYPEFGSTMESWFRTMDERTDSWAKATDQGIENLWKHNHFSFFRVPNKIDIRTPILSAVKSFRDAIALSQTEGIEWHAKETCDEVSELWLWRKPPLSGSSMCSIEELGRLFDVWTQEIIETSRGKLALLHGSGFLKYWVQGYEPSIDQKQHVGSASVICTVKETWQILEDQLCEELVLEFWARPFEWPWEPLAKNCDSSRALLDEAHAQAFSDLPRKDLPNFGKLFRDLNEKLLSIEMSEACKTKVRDMLLQGMT